MAEESKKKFSFLKLTPGAWNTIKTITYVVGVFIVFDQYTGWRVDKRLEPMKEAYKTDLQIRDSKIEEQQKSIKDNNDSLSSLEQEIDSIQTLLQSKIVLSDTILYPGDAVAILDGKITITCMKIDLAEPMEFRYAHLEFYFVDKSFKVIRGGNFHGMTLGKENSIRYDAYLGNVTDFQFQGKNYSIVTVGCKEYAGQPGVKIKIFRLD